MERQGSPICRSWRVDASRPWFIIGNLENRRVALFQQALASHKLPPATVLTYEGLLSGRETLRGLAENAILRVESPGENFAVEKLLLAAGAAAAEQEGGRSLTTSQIEQLFEDRGRIFYPRQWYLGFIRACESWFGKAQQNPAWTTTTSARNLGVLFDKLLCQHEFSSAKLPIPASLGRIANWDDLNARMRASGFRRVFVKLANGSSASGVIALHVRGDAIEAITSIELVRENGEIRLYNSLKIRRYTKLDDVREIVDALAPHSVHVEQWLPKASIDRRVFDLRIVTIAGVPRHVVVRTSRSPITNLHLANRRGNWDELRARIPPNEVESLEETCRRCARLFPDSLHLGLDVLFTPGFREHFLLEVNAFGDLLPGVLHGGRDTYQSEIAAMISN